MATTIRGTAILKFGTYAVTGLIVQDDDVEYGGATQKIADEDGQNISFVEKNDLTETLSIRVIPKSTATVPAIADSFTYNSVVYSITNFKRTRSNKNVETWAITAMKLTGVTFS